MSVNIFLAYTLLLLSSEFGKCAKILTVLPSTGYSQYILAESLIITLADRGHEVTVISAFETKNVNNLRNIVVELGGAEDTSSDLLHIAEEGIFSNIRRIHEHGLDISEKLLSHRKVQELIHSGEKFDLVLVETFFNGAHQAFANHFNAHHVLFHSMTLNEWNSHLVANPYFPSILPTTFTGYTNHMNFNQRFKNLIAFLYDRYIKYMIHYPAHQHLVDKYFPGSHNLDEIIYNASLMLTCSHFGISGALPLTSSVIEVGGLHIVNRSLPNNVKAFLDSAKHGAIFFSLGSNLKSSNLPKEIIASILEAFGNLEQKILWKFEDDQILEKIPQNVMIAKWFPQNDILAHQNTVLFISHCGMGSTTEAIFHGIPVIGIPIFGDQFMNIKRLVALGMGLELSSGNLSGPSLHFAIEEVLYNKRYKYSARKRSSISKDRPQKPLDLAVYWIEYVLKHDGAHHLKNSIIDLSWYQLYLLDIVGVIIITLISIIYLIFSIKRLLGNREVIKRKQE